LVVGAGLSSGSLNSRSDIINQSKLVFNRSGTATYSGQISGSGSLEQIGSGTLALSGNNTYTGATTIAAGSTLALVDAGTIETSSHVVNHGFLSFAQAIGTVGLTNLTGSGTTDLGVQSLILNNANGLYSGVLSGAGGVSLNGSDTYSLSGNNTYTGVTSIGNGETLALLGSGSISASSGISNSGNFSIVNASNAVTIRNLTGSGSTNLGNKSLTLTAASGRYDGAIVGVDGAFGVDGAGTYSLSGSNTYTGATTIGAGSTLSVTKGGAISRSSGIINSGTFSVDEATSPVTITMLTGSGSTNLGNQSLILSAASGRNDGVISGQGGALTLQGAGTYSLSGFNTYTGATTIATGSTLALVAGGSINPSSGVFNSGSLSIAAATSPVGLKNMTGSGDTNLGNQTLTLTNANGLYSGVISGLGGSLSIDGSGTYSLNAANTYTGATTIGDGSTLALLGSGSISASSEVRNSGNFSVSNASSAVAITTLNGSGSTSLGNQTLSLTAASGVNSGVITGNGGNLLIGGSDTYTLRGLNTYTGSTSLGGQSTLVVEGSIAPSSALTVTAGATLSGSGNMPSTTIASGAILAPNNAGTTALSITGGSGNLTLNSGSTSNFSISPTNSDRLTANGAIKLDGTLNLAFTNGSFLTKTPYVLFSGQSLSGTFASIATSGLPSLYLYSLDYSTSALNLWLSANLPAGQSEAISGLSSITISGGTIIIDTPGSHNTSLVLAVPTGSTTNTIDGNGLSVTLTGDISGSGPLTFSNSQASTSIGTITLSANNSYTGSTTVGNGVKLAVNSSLASSANLTVNAGAIIAGNGTVPATTIVPGGTLAPGNSIGQLTLASLDFGPGGILDAEIQGPQNDKTTVTGSVTNFSGNANLIAFGGGTPWPNFNYQLITAANDFAHSPNLTLTPVGITSALLLRGTTLVQEADGNPKTFDVMWRPNNGSGATASAMAALGQTNRNQLAAAGVFDSAFRRLAVAAGDASGSTNGLNAPGPAIGSTGFTTGQAAAAGLSPEFLSTTAQLLGVSSPSQLTAAISTITPEPYAAFQSVGLETLQRQRQQLLASAGQCASSGWVINGPTRQSTKAATNPICLYGQASNTYSSINGQAGLSSYNSGIFSSFYGLEVKANAYWSLGAAYGYGTSNLNGLGITNAWVNSTVNSASLYGVYTPTTSSPWTFKGLVGYGNYAINGSRRVAGIGAGNPITGSTTSHGLTAALTAELAIPLTPASAPVPVLLKPLLGIAFGSYQQAGFSETGGGPLNLNVDGSTARSLVGTIGLEMTSGAIPLNRAKTIALIPRLAFAYQLDALANELGNSSLSASMPASSSGSFLTQGQNRGVHGLTIAGGVDLALGQSTALYANVMVEAFSSGSQFGYGGGIRFKF
jgi:autotransporter-associated beta strand protein